MSINCVTISGNLTRDAKKQNTTTTGTPVLNFTVAVNDRRKNSQSGEWEDHPNFIDCSMFGARADSLEKYLKKGVKVTVAGKLRQSSWVDKDTQKNRSSISVLVDDIEFSTRNNNNAGGDSASTQSESTSYVEDTPAAENFSDDDAIPF